jgi:nanoRNase/pAp phosphatase (c-di-AMP/oligoRNAs hydrolase)
MLRSDCLLQVLSAYDRCLVVTHDNPDPDAIATGWAIVCLIQEKLRIPVRLVGGGAIVRAENRYMVELLNPPIELASSLEVDPGTATVLVDCGVGTTNQLLTRESIAPTAVIDHHLSLGRNPRVPFRDIRPSLAASVTIGAAYLREQDIEPGEKLATAMLYAFHTETQGFESRYSPLDRSILLWVTERADPSLLAAIHNAPLAREYFGDLVLALQSTFIYGDTALCLLPRANGSEIVGEVADLLIRDRGLQRVLCGAVVGDDLLLSARTERDSDDASLLLQTTLQGLGRAGGHAHRAGGKIAGVARQNRITEELEDQIRTRWLAACGIARQRGTRLVSRRDIVGNL